MIFPNSLMNHYENSNSHMILKREAYRPRLSTKYHSPWIDLSESHVCISFTLMSYP